MFQTSGNKLYSNHFDHFLPEKTQNLASQCKGRLCCKELLTRAQPCSFQKGLPLGNGGLSEERYCLRVPLRTGRSQKLQPAPKGERAEVPDLLESIMAAYPAALGPHWKNWAAY